MKPKSLILTAILVTSVSLGGCDQVRKLVGGGTPKGQVVATVDGKEITALELRQEMGGFSARDPAVMKQAQQQALQQLILRRLVVAEAKKQKLDKGADYILQVKRGEEALLGQLYQRKIGGSVAVPSREEAEAYISSHPEKFAARRIMVVEQLIAAPSKVAPQRFQPLNSLEEVRGLLDSERVPYQTNISMLDTLSTDPRLLQQLAKLPPGEVFVIPQRGTLVFNRIIETKSAPFGGDPAVAYASNALRNERAQQAVARQMQLMRKSAEPSIVYADGFKPPKTPAAAPAAPAPAAAPAAEGGPAAPPTPAPARSAAGVPQSK